MDTTMTRVAAVARLLVTLLLTVAAGVGWQLDTNLILQITSTVLALASVCWAWWKNAPITEAAIDAQEVLYELKSKDVPDWLAAN